jgi:acyl transferase domain-containing protein
MNQPVAIIGMGCQFPGAPNLQSFWSTVCNASVNFSEVPIDRWNHHLFYSPNGRKAEKTYARKGGFLEDVRSFCPEFFGIPPRRMKVIDPQHRLLLEAVRMALEDAGYAKRGFPVNKTGVFIGASVSEHKEIVSSRLRALQLFSGAWGNIPDLPEEIRNAAVEYVTPMQAYSMVGNLINIAAANIAQSFKWEGPAFAVDAACSSTLVALHEAWLHLRSGLCDAALVGGVYVNLLPDSMIAFSCIGALSRTDSCRPFDGRADGFVLGEGVGALLLKRLEDAQRDGDRIYAVILGAGITNNGDSGGLMAPDRAGQVAALTRAYQEAGVPPDTIGLVEAHGSATPLGDATEIGALRDCFTANKQERIDCCVTSVKGNIGHAMSAAGAAGLIKGVLAVSEGVIPKQAGYELPSPELSLEGTGFRIPTNTVPWDEGPAGPRRAGVSSFGFGGTNVHVVLEQAPRRVSTRRKATVCLRPTSDQPELFFVSSPTPALLERHLDAILRTLTEEYSRATLCDLSFTLALRRSDSARTAFVARTRAELIRKLTSAKAAAAGLANPTGIWFAPAPLQESDRRIALRISDEVQEADGLCRFLAHSYPAFRAGSNARKTLALALADFMAMLGLESQGSLKTRPLPLGHDEMESGVRFLEILAESAVLGAPVDILKLLEGRDVRQVSLPPSLLEVRSTWAIEKKEGPQPAPATWVTVQRSNGGCDDTVCP